jgi:signal peptidase I
MLRLLKVAGTSLLPFYYEGDFVLLLKIPFFFNHWLQPGDTVVFRHTDYGLMIKNVAQISPDEGEIYVLGTHPGSTDSRQFGAVPLDSVLGKVVWHFQNPEQPSRPPTEM